MLKFIEMHESDFLEYFPNSELALDSDLINLNKNILQNIVIRLELSRGHLSTFLAIKKQ